jgi:RNA polymerase sigma-70 factor (ECF subfamily)
VTATGGRPRTLDDASHDWLRCLAADRRDESLVPLRALLLQATQFEVARRRHQLLDVDDLELDELACTAADAALIQVIEHLDEYRGGSRFTTWAAKFAIVEAAIRLRELAWHSSACRAPQGQVRPEWLVTLAQIDDVLTPDQRHLLNMLTVHGAPIDVVAEGMRTTRDDVYRKLQTIRALLRERLTRKDTA